MISDEINPGHLNLVAHEKSRKIIYEVMNDLASVKSTLGPGGKANLVHDPEDMSVYPSKDGFRLVMGMHYDDYFYDTILKTIRDASEHNNRMIGDGTTSAIVILEKFYTTLEKYVSEHAEGFQHISLTGVVNILKTLKSVLKEELISKGYIKFLKDYDIDTQKAIITKVATIAANNDRTVGEYIAKLFNNIIEKGKGDELFVDIKPNYMNETDESTEIGFRMPCGYIHRVYATERDGVTAIYKDPRFLLIEGPIMEGDIEVIDPIIMYTAFELNKPIVIIASEYVGKVAQYLYSLRLGGSERPNPEFNPKLPEDQEKNPRVFILPPIDVLPLQYGTDNDTGHERMVDLETALGGRAIPALTQHWEMGKNPNEWDTILGRAKSITTVPHDSSITGGMGETAKIEGRIAKITEDLDAMKLADTNASIGRIEEYRERIGMLNSNMVTIRVGGGSFKDRKYNVLVYEDAVYAVKSTIKNGFTLAGQVSIQNLIKNHKASIVDKVFDRLKAEGRNVTFGANRRKILADAISAILNIISDTFSEAYKIAIENAILDTNERNHIYSEIYNRDKNECMAYNLMTDTYESLHPDNQMLVPGNTDYETFAAVIEITNIFLNTDNLETLYIPRRVESKKEQ